jgi:hypothetical protein
LIIAGRVLTSAVLESCLGSGSDSGTTLNLGTCPDAVSDLGSDPSIDSLPFHFPVTFVASLAAEQKKVLTN